MGASNGSMNNQNSQNYAPFPHVFTTEYNAHVHVRADGGWSVGMTEASDNQVLNK